jgi:F-box/leucine-rich repeat protein 2/20
VTGVSLQALADFCPRLELLRLEGFQGLTPADLLVLSQRCRGLRELDLTDCGLDDAACAALAQFGRLEVGDLLVFYKYSDL